MISLYSILSMPRVQANFNPNESKGEALQISFARKMELKVSNRLLLVSIYCTNHDIQIYPLVYGPTSNIMDSRSLDIEPWGVEC